LYNTIHLSTDHTLWHIDELLTLIDAHADACSDVPALRLAAWFHDLIYAVAPPSVVAQNEPLSADAFAAFVDDVCVNGSGDDDNSEGGVAASSSRLSALCARRDKVCSFINATKTHCLDADASSADPAAVEDCALFLDFDLAVLGRRPLSYGRYAAQIRFEYSAVPLAAYRTGRSRILASLAAKASLYETDLGRRLWQTRAVANLRAEIYALTHTDFPQN
jgi:predicted metal-dependent HD superfamily phosphohydrolase